MSKQKLSPAQAKALISTLKGRFEKNTKRHKGLDWAKIEAKLEGNPGKLDALQQMESTGGEPDVIGHDKKTGEYIFCDCSAESPVGRRSLCYDREALDSRKENKPKDSAMDMAKAIGVELLTEAQYRELQQLGIVDEVVAEPLDGAHRDPAAAAASLKAVLIRHLDELAALPTQDLVDRRYAKYRAMGSWVAA